MIASVISSSTAGVGAAPAHSAQVDRLAGDHGTPACAAAGRSLLGARVEDLLRAPLRDRDHRRAGDSASRADAGLAAHRPEVGLLGRGALRIDDHDAARPGAPRPARRATSPRRPCPGRTGICRACAGTARPPERPNRLALARNRGQRPASVDEVRDDQRVDVGHVVGRDDHPAGRRHVAPARSRCASSQHLHQRLDTMASRTYAARIPSSASAPRSLHRLVPATESCLATVPVGTARGRIAAVAGDWTVVVPVKPLAAAKSRLRGAVPDAEHAELALRHGSWTRWRRCCACPAVRGVLVVHRRPGRRRRSRRWAPGACRTTRRRAERGDRASARTPSRGLAGRGPRWRPTCRRCGPAELRGRARAAGGRSFVRDAGGHRHRAAGRAAGRGAGSALRARLGGGARRLRRRGARPGTGPACAGRRHPGRPARRPASSAPASPTSSGSRADRCRERWRPTTRTRGPGRCSSTTGASWRSRRRRSPRPACGCCVRASG